MENDFDFYIKLGSILKDIMQADLSTTIVDRELTCLYYRPGDSINFNLKPGDKVPSDDVIQKAFIDGKVSVVKVPKEIFGFYFKGTIYPIKNSQQNIIGAVLLGENLKKQGDVEDASNNIFASLQQTTSAIQDINSGSQTLFSSIDCITRFADTANQKIHETDSILKLIEAVASQSKLLALNAAIESARAGEVGKGFSVVAGEMKKMSDQSGESAKKISKLLQEMRKSVDDIVKEINSANQIAESQAAATEEITASYSEIVSNSKSLVEFCKLL